MECGCSRNNSVGAASIFGKVIPTAKLDTSKSNHATNNLISEDDQVRSSLEAIQSRYSGVTTVMREFYCIYVTHKMAVDGDVMQLTLNGGVTGLSFDEIGQVIGSMRVERYLRQKSLWEMEMLSYKKDLAYKREAFGLDVEEVELPQFGLMDDRRGYNEQITIDSEYLVALFKGYVDLNQEFITEMLDGVIPHWCVSLDHTYEVASRTKDYSEGTVDPIDESTYLCAINGTGVAIITVIDITIAIITIIAITIAIITIITIIIIIIATIIAIIIIIIIIAIIYYHYRHHHRH